jgi:hypothetical protein
VAIALLPCAAAAQEAGPGADPKERLVTARGSVEWISALRWLDPRDTALNPDNAIFRIPGLWLQTELRPDGRLGVGPRVTFVARPRLYAWNETSWSDGNSTSRREASANWTELFVNWRATDNLQVTYGLQNFQWGPAELLSPSNRIFHEVGLFRDPIYYVRGRHLARVNASVGKAWSLVALGELGDNGEVDFNAGEPFRRQGQVKLEYASPSGGNYVGVTAGAREGSRPWFGEYAAFSLSEGLSAYVDASHTRGGRAWYPVRDGAGAFTFGRKEERNTAWRTLAVAGVRYTFATGVDARIEYLHQDTGYSDADMTTTAIAAAGARTPEDLSPYFAPGLEFLGRRLILASVRWPDLPPSKHLVVQGRYLVSATDRSGVAFTTASLDAADRLVIFASVTVTHGRDVAEFSRAVRASLVAGTVWTW